MTDSTQPKRTKLSVDLLLALSWMLICVPACAFAVIQMRTLPGILTGGVGICLGLLPASWLLWWKQNQPQYRTYTVVLIAIALIASGIVLALAPSRVPAADARLQQYYTNTVTIDPYVPSNFVPESDQLRIGFALLSRGNQFVDEINALSDFINLPRLDPFFDMAQSQRILPPTMEIYQQLEADPDFAEVGSTLGWSYNQILNQPWEVGHYYLYIPESAGAEPLPTMVFLHGSFGNFKGYTWVLRDLAEARGMAIIAPSYGLGNWDTPQTSAVIERTLSDAEQHVAIDHERVYLAGISNGGVGVLNVLNTMSSQFSGAIFISSVLQSEILDANAQVVPMLFLTGQLDERVPVDYIRRYATQLDDADFNVTLQTWADADHFLLFTHREAVIDAMNSWLTTLQR